MTKKNLLRLMKKAEKNGFVQLDNGFKLVTKDWIINNIKSSNLSKENLETELENYEWREIDSSYLVQYLLENKTVKQPGFYLLDEDNYIHSDSFNMDFPYEIENISETRCYILTYYNSDDTYIIELGYLAKSVSEEIFTIFASIYDDVSIYAYKDDSSYNDDNIWSKIS